MLRRGLNPTQDLKRIGTGMRERTYYEEWNHCLALYLGITEEEAEWVDTWDLDSETIENVEVMMWEFD